MGRPPFRRRFPQCSVFVLPPAGSTAATGLGSRSRVTIHSFRPFWDLFAIPCPPFSPRAPQFRLYWLVCSVDNSSPCHIRRQRSHPTLRIPTQEPSGGPLWSPPFSCFSPPSLAVFGPYRRVFSAMGPILRAPPDLPCVDYLPLLPSLLSPEKLSSSPTKKPAL
jgi:hypothetical protein